MSLARNTPDRGRRPSREPPVDSHDSGEVWPQARREAKSDGELDAAAVTPGITRRVAFEESDEYWFGHVETAAGMTSGWHHHGEMTTFGHILEGTLWFEFGPGGKDRVEVVAGDYFRIPAGVVHREGTTTDGPGSAILGRVGGGQPVFPVDGPDPE